MGDPRLPEPPSRLGIYEIVRRLGAGPSNELLLARAQGPFGFARSVVIKRLLESKASDEDAVRALENEALASSRLNHETVVRLYENAPIEGHPALVLEYVDGLSLSSLLARLSMRGGDLDDDAIRYIGYRVFTALAAAHAAKDGTGAAAPIVHGGLCPSNVLIPWDGKAKLSDFSLAKLAGPGVDPSASLLNATYEYMAPEQAIGESVTVRTDVYLGCLLVRELFARKPTFPKLPELALLQAMADAAFPPLDELRPDLPKELLAALKRGLARDASVRTITALEMIDALQADMNLEKGRTSLCGSLVRMRNVVTPKQRDVVRVAAPARRASERPLAITTTVDVETKPRGPGSVPSLDEIALPIHVGDPMSASGAQAAFPPTALEAAVNQIRDRALARERDAAKSSPRPPSVASDEGASAAASVGDVPPSGDSVRGYAAPVSRRTQGAPVYANLGPVTDVAGMPSPLFRVRRSALKPILALGAVAFAALGVAIAAPTGKSQATSPSPQMSVVAVASAAKPVVVSTVTPSAAPPAASTPPVAVPSSVAAVASVAPALEAPAPTAAPTPAPLSASNTPIRGGTRGVLTLGVAAKDHRVYLDGVLVGEGQGPFEVPCGPHQMRIGTRGEAKAITVICSAK